MAFIKHWARFLLGLDSWTDRAWRFAGFLLTSTVTGMTNLLPSVYWSWQPPWGIYEGNIYVGWLIFGLAVGFYLSATAGAAWVLSRGPTILLDDWFLEDIDYEMYRLRVRVTSGIHEPEVFLTKILDHNGKPIQEIRWNFELGWMDKKSDESARVSHNVSGTVDVLMIRPSKLPETKGVPSLYACGAKDKFIPIDVDIPWGERLRLHLEVTARLHHDSEEVIAIKWYSLEPNWDAPLKYTLKEGLRCF